MYGPRTQASGETNYLEQKLQVLDRTKALYGLRTQASGETNYLEKKTTSFGQNQGLVWSSDSSLWGNHLLKRKNAGFGHNLDVIWPLESTPEEGYPLIVGLIPRLNKIPSLPLDPQYQGNWCNCYRVRCYQNTIEAPLCSATLSDGIFRVYRSQTVASHALRSIQLLSRLVSLV